MSDLVRVWGLHCDEDIDLVSEGAAAIGWDALGDLNALAADRAAFREAVRRMWPSARPRAIAQWAGQLYRFVHAARTGDAVVYRERGGGPINVGTLDGPYEHHAGVRYGQRRPVAWSETGLPADAFPPEARYELGASLTWFAISRHREMWLSVLHGPG